MYQSALLVAEPCGLRDYGTGLWEGGDPECDHPAPLGGGSGSSTLYDYWDKGERGQALQAAGVRQRQPQYREVCAKCGARRVDQQLGLEPTPEAYVARMVDVFREVKRVLRADGTCWLNIGSSYASSPPGNVEGVGATSGLHGANDVSGTYRETLKAGHATKRSTIGAGYKAKDMVPIPWMLAMALQEDGWYLRSDIIWSKPNPMPESVTDRPTKAHEYVFLLSKGPRYFFDQEAVREKYLAGPGLTGGAYDPPGQSPHSNARGPDGRHNTRVLGADGSIQHRDGERWPNGGRNVRSVWEIATEPYPDAHFATFPQALVERCVKAGTSERGCCPVCGKPWEREVERGETDYARLKGERDWQVLQAAQDHRGANQGGRTGKNTLTAAGTVPSLKAASCETLGWRPGCDHDAPPAPCTVLDVFIGSGTTALAARRLGRRTIGIELSVSYCKLAADRLAQLSLLAEEFAS